MADRYMAKSRESVYDFSEFLGAGIMRAMCGMNI